MSSQSGYALQVALITALGVLAHSADAACVFETDVAKTQLTTLLANGSSAANTGCLNIASTTTLGAAEFATVEASAHYEHISTARIEVQTASIPLPSAAWLIISGLIGLVGVARPKVS